MFEVANAEDFLITSRPEMTLENGIKIVFPRKTALPHETCMRLLKAINALIDLEYEETK